MKKSILKAFCAAIGMISINQTAHALMYQTLPPSGMDAIQNAKQSITRQGALRFTRIDQKKYMALAVGYSFDVPANKEASIELLYENWVDNATIIADICVPKYNGINRLPENQTGVSCFKKEVKLETAQTSKIHTVDLYKRNSDWKLDQGFYTVRLIINIPVDIYGLRLKYDNPASIAPPPPSEP